jgi:glutamate dehydrogenase
VVVARAARRGHPLAAAFMSSKPGAGINHKEYGVTSEGVTVFLEVALRADGHRPRAQDFTVKLTGGPDGDVAGNEIKILHREYGEHARIVGIADGSGSARRPRRARPRRAPAPRRALDAHRAFDPARSSAPAGGDPRRRARGRAMRNTLHNRVVADAFIPAGGRPQTIHAGNWQELPARPTARRRRG